MPVLITGATGLVGRALAQRLLDEGAQVRAYIRRDDDDLREAGVHIAIGEAGDVQRLEAALTGVHTIVALVGGLWPEAGFSYDALNRDPTECAVIAARAAGVKRFVFMSFAGADAASGNEFLAAKGKAEAHVTASDLEYAIVRCAPIVDGLPALFRRLTKGPMLHVPGNGRQRLAPVALDDVIAALVTADAREAEVRATWTLGGAHVFSMDDLASTSVKGKRITHIPVLSPAPKTLIDALARDIVPGSGLRPVA